METYLTDLKRVYRSSFAFARLCPLLFLVPVLGEFIQHIVEIRVGMYSSRDAWENMQYRDARQYSGVVKLLTLAVPTYCYVRYLGFGDSPTAARRIEFPAVLLWLPVVVFTITSPLLMMFMPEIVEFSTMSFAELGVLVFSFNAFVSLLGIYLLGWSIAWPMGNASIGWVSSFRLMHGFFLRAVVYMIVASIPYLVLHYGLAYVAVGSPEWLIWIVLTLDAFLVGFLALNLAGAGYMVVSRAAKKKGIHILLG